MCFGFRKVSEVLSETLSEEDFPLGHSWSCSPSIILENLEGMVVGWEHQNRAILCGCGGDVYRCPQNHVVFKPEDARSPCDQKSLVGFGRRGPLEKESFQKSLFSREFRDSRVSREPPNCGKKWDSDHFLEILENMEILKILEIAPAKRPLS